MAFLMAFLMLTCGAFLPARSQGQQHGCVCCTQRQHRITANPAISLIRRAKVTAPPQANCEPQTRPVKIVAPPQAKQEPSHLVGEIFMQRGQQHCQLRLGPGARHHSTSSGQHGILGGAEAATLLSDLCAGSGHWSVPGSKLQGICLDRHRSSAWLHTASAHTLKSMEDASCGAALPLRIGRQNDYASMHSCEPCKPTPAWAGTHRAGTHRGGD
eukprot:801969-Pelagomonas_calceolata.AAC.6